MNALFSLSSKDLQNNRLRAVRGTERLSEPYAFDLVIELEPGALEDLDAPVGQAATLSFNDERGVPQDDIHGILSTFELLEVQPERELYLARLVPRLWWLAQSQHSRVFVGEKLPAILDQVLRHAGWADPDFRIAVKGRPGEGSPVLEHVCQYRESDLAFVSRWLEREGIYYFFEHGDGDREKLVITDDPEQHDDRRAGPQPYVPRGAAAGALVEGFRAFRRTARAQPAGVRLADYSYEKPGVAISHQEKKGEGEIVSLFGEGARTQAEARWLAQVRLQELRAQQVIYRGAGWVHGIHPATTFSLENHPRISEELRAIEVTHRGLDLEGRPNLGELVEAALGEELEDGYQVEVVAIPAAVQYRPPRVTPTPRITGVESAVVEGGGAGQYAQLDDQGRYAVRLKFDENESTRGKASTRVRMVQPFGGEQEGMHFPLRPNTEVMVMFVGGHPDRPIIAGATPNAETVSPVTALNASQNVIQTSGGNRLVMEDTVGGQAVRVSSPTKSSALGLGAGAANVDLSTEGVGRIHTGSDLKIEVGSEGGDATKDLHETVLGSVTRSAGGNLEQVVTGTSLHKLDSERVRIEARDGKLDIKSTSGLTVKDGGTPAVTIEAKDGGLTITTGGGVSITTGGGVSINAGSDISLTSANKVSINAVNGIDIGSENPYIDLSPTQISVTYFFDLSVSPVLSVGVAGTTVDAVLRAAEFKGGTLGVVGAKFEFTAFDYQEEKAKMEKANAKIESADVKVKTGQVSVDNNKLKVLA